MQCTANVKKLPQSKLTQLKENLAKLKLFRASNEMSCNNYNKEWRELFDSLMPAAQETIAAINEHNAKQRKLSQRIKRIVFRTPSDYRITPYLLQAIADNVNYGITMSCSNTIDYQLLDEYFVEFSPISVATVDRMRTLAQRYRRSKRAWNDALLKINNLEAILTAVENEYASVPNISLSTLEELLNPKELTQ